MCMLKVGGDGVLLGQLRLSMGHSWCFSQAPGPAGVGSGASACLGVDLQHSGWAARSWFCVGLLFGCGVCQPLCVLGRGGHATQQIASAAEECEPVCHCCGHQVTQHAAVPCVYWHHQPPLMRLWQSYLSVTWRAVKPEIDRGWCLWGHAVTLNPDSSNHTCGMTEQFREVQ
jgi:hypothetical protein